MSFEMGKIRQRDRECGCTVIVLDTAKTVLLQEVKQGAAAARDNL